MTTTNSPFAIALAFYHNYFQDRLLEEDQGANETPKPTSLLLKIAQKYRNKPNKLLSDLIEKYAGYKVEDNVSKDELVRLLFKYQVPQAYIDLFCFNTPLPNYDARIDVYSSNFNPSYLLSKGGSIELLPHLQEISKDRLIVDNLSKASNLIPCLPNYEPKLDTSRTSTITSAPISSSLSSSKISEEETKKKEEIKRPLFDRLADHTVELKRKRNGDGSDNYYSESDETLISPLILLKECMMQKVRVRVITRRKKG